MKKPKYTLLRSIDKWIDEQGNMFEISENGNIDDSEDGKFGNVISMPAYWWKLLSPYDHDTVNTIWRSIWDK